MRKLTLLFMAGLGALLPATLWSQFMADYYPTGLPAIRNTVNLVTVVETYPDNSGESRSVNTILEDQFSSTSDVWVHSVDRRGNPTLSMRYGIKGVEESASAIVRCPNGDFIVAGNTESDGLPSVWLLRIDLAGNVVWSNRYYNDNNKLRSYCIKQVNEPFAREAYVIAGTTDGDRTLMAFKVNRNGGVLWHNTYTDPSSPVDIINVPKSMIVVDGNVIIAGNRRNALSVNRDIFLIGINHSSGVESINYRYIDNGGRDEADPFINYGENGEYVLTYQSTANIFGVNTGRIAFNRLTAGLLLSLPNTSIYWEWGATNSYGHSIYLENGFALQNYTIGGGTTVNGQNNPLAFSIDNNGLILPGTYRRLWVDERQFTSTFMMQDAFIGGNQYEHHNYYLNSFQDPSRGTMSLLRDQFLPTPCNKFFDLAATTLAATLTLGNYKESPFLQPKEYPVDVEKVHGDYKMCDGHSGSFKQETVSGKAAPAKAITPQTGFKLYPTLVSKGMPVNIRFEAGADGQATITIYNMQSQQVWQQSEKLRKGSNQLTIAEIGNLPAGTFIVEVKTGTEAYKTKIVRQ